MGKYYQKNRYVSFWDTVEDEDGLWVADICMNGLFKIKKDGSDVEYVAPFEMERIGKAGHGLYFYAVSYGDEIFFLPKFSFNVAVYSRKKKVLQYIYLPYIGGVAGYGIVGYALYGEWMYLFSTYADCSMIRIHMTTWEVEELQIWKDILGKFSDKKNHLITASAVQINNDVWMDIYHTNKLLRYSLVDDSYEIIEYDYDIYKVFGNESLQELYIVPRKKKQVVIWDLRSRKKKQCIELGDFICDNNKIRNILSDEELFVFIPDYEKYILLIDRKSNTIRKYDSFPQEYTSFKTDNRFFYSGRIRSEYIELFPYMANGIIRIDRKSGEAMLQCTEIPWKGSIGDLVLQYHYQNSITNVECNEFIYPLEHFLEVLSSGEGHKKEYEGGKVGKDIAEAVLSESKRGKI